MNTDINAFMAGRCFEKLNRILRVIGKDFKCKDEIHFAIQLPSEVVVDVVSIQNAFYHTFQMYNITNRYKLKSITLDLVDWALDVRIELSFVEE